MGEGVLISKELSGMKKREEAEMLAGGKVGAKKEAALVNGGGLDLLAVTSWQAPHTKNADAFSVVGMPC